MPATPDLAATFLAHARVRLVPPEDAATLNRVLTHAWESARAPWPTVVLAPELFVRHLAERLPSEGPESPLEPLLQQVSLEDLYLACACLHDVPLAIETFEQHYLRKLPKLLRHRERSAAALDEICQQARVKILVSTPEGPPKLAEYKGKGTLLKWVQVIALRIATRLAAAQKPTPEEEVDKILGALPGPGDAPEMAVIKQHHHEDLRHAMREAFSSLSDDDRYLLRLYYVDRLSMYDLEPLLRISQPTISRRLKNAREKIYTETRRHVQARLGLSQQEFQSFMKLLDSQFDLRLSQLLGDSPAPD
jgi:RNA polymerase sigma-70 factor (ECF subfamily)